MPRIAPAHLAAILLGLAGLAMLASGLAGQSRNGTRIILSVVLVSAALIVSGLQLLLGRAAAPAAGDGGDS